MLRGSGLFRDIWIPPFPNDSGAAIGTACCEMFRRGGQRALGWDVYSGPVLSTGDVPRDWRVRPCSERQLAELLHAEGEPVVVLSGRSEIGPRALGNRSILAPATNPAMKSRLNVMKGRADTARWPQCAWRHVRLRSSAWGAMTLICSSSTVPVQAGPTVSPQSRIWTALHDCRPCTRRPAVPRTRPGPATSLASLRALCRGLLRRTIWRSRCSS